MNEQAFSKGALPDKKDNSVLISGDTRHVYFLLPRQREFSKKTYHIFTFFPLLRFRLLANDPSGRRCPKRSWFRLLYGVFVLAFASTIGYDSLRLRGGTDVDGWPQVLSGLAREGK
jgi:hypothetical protein